MTTREAGGIALVLVVLAILLAGAFRTVEIVQERHALQQRRAQQEKPLHETAQLRRRVEALAAGVAQLASQGDAAAKAVAEAMRRQGVVLHAPQH
jgi:cell division protein FtsB